MKRPMTLTSAILSTIMHAIYSIAEIYLLTVISSLGDDATIFIVSFILAIALSVVSLVFNAISIPAWNKDAEGFAKKRKFIITALVFNFIIILFMIIGMFTSPTVGVLDIIILLVLIAANVLYIVDICLENKRVGKTAEVAATEEAPKAAALEDKIEKLNEMKAQGIISDEEYEELKKSYINEKVNG